MPLTSHKDRLKCAISNTPGTSGALTVATPSSGFVGFVAGDDGKTFDCVLVDGTAWEVRSGCVYTHSGTSLSRGTLLFSSTGGAVNLTSATVVSDSLSASKMGAIEHQLDRGFTSIVNAVSATQVLANGLTKMTTALGTVVKNPYSWWNTGTSRFVPNRAGLYVIMAGAQVTAGAARVFQGALQKNGAGAAGSPVFTGTEANLQITAVIEMNGTTDYLEWLVYANGAGNTLGDEVRRVYFDAYFLSAS